MRASASIPDVAQGASRDDLTFDATGVMARFARAGLIAAESCRRSGGGFVWVVNASCAQAPLRAEARSREGAWRRAEADAEQAGLFDRPPEAD
jgi:hypothetical protein